MEVIAKTAKAWFLGIPIVGHCLKPISTEIQDCQDVQTEPGNPLGRHAPFSLREKRSTKPPIWCKSGSTAAGIMARHAQLWGVTANIPNVPNVESTHLESGVNRLHGHGRRKPRLWLCIAHFIRPDSHSQLVCLHFCTFRLSPANPGLLWEDLCVFLHFL